MNYATIKECDVANGPGVRVSVFVSGCNHHCKGCFNEIAWDFEYGEKFTEDTINKVIKDLDHDYIEGLSLLGGEPLEHSNQKGLLPLIKQVKEKFPNKTVWSWTGFSFDKDLKDKEVSKYIDVLVDGQYVEALRDPKLKYAGSSNQRVIDVQKSLKENKLILWD